MTTKQSYEWWKAEQIYIKSINPKNPPIEFHTVLTSEGYDVNAARDCFAKYCDMQALRVINDGFPLMAKDMKDAADIARFKDR